MALCGMAWPLLSGNVSNKFFFSGTDISMSSPSHLGELVLVLFIVRLKFLFIFFNINLLILIGG